VPDRPGIGDLPAFVTRGDLEALGLGRRAIDGLFRALPVVTFPDVRRMFLRREDVARYVEAHTYPSDELRP
jgi:hypothetical protein